MTDVTIRPTVDHAPPQASNGTRRFLRHLAEMLVAMVVGMVLFDPVWETIGKTAYQRVDVGALAMATGMSLGMAVWMRHRGHGWARIAEMSAAMYVPFLLVLVPYWMGLVPGNAVGHVGHSLMLPAMVLAMVWRRDEYTRMHQTPTWHGPLDAVVRRWPTLLALLVTFGVLAEPFVSSPWIVLILPGGYLLIGAFRGTLRDRKALAIQVAGAAGYLALVLVAVSVDERLAAYLLAAGWIAHAIWDLVHHIADKVVPKGYAEFCIVVDLVVGVTIVLSVL